MNPAYVHIVLNHIPVLWTPLGLGVLAVALLRGSGDAKKAALGILVLSAAVTVPVHLTGDGAATVVAKLPGVDAARIAEHDQSATWALITNLALGAVAAACLLFYRRSRDLPRGWTTVILVMALFTTTVLVRTAQLGGRIHHAEARPGFQPPPAVAE